MIVHADGATERWRQPRVEPWEQPRRDPGERRPQHRRWRRSAGRLRDDGANVSALLEQRRRRRSAREATAASASPRAPWHAHQEQNAPPHAPLGSLGQIRW